MRRNIILLASGFNILKDLILHLDICDILSFFMTHVRESLSMTRLQQTLLHYFTLKVMKYGVFSSLYSLLQSLKKMSNPTAALIDLYRQFISKWTDSEGSQVVVGNLKRYYWLSVQKSKPAFRLPPKCLHDEVFTSNV